MKHQLKIVGPADGPFSKIEDGVAAIRRRQMVIVVDDEDRENEGDLTIAAWAIRYRMVASGNSCLAGDASLPDGQPPPISKHF